MNMPSPTGRAVANITHFLEKLEQMEQVIWYITPQVRHDAEDLQGPWATAHRVCDNYYIPRTA
jgi:hypothetical protein